MKDPDHFDFDDWARLASDDPQAFEQRRLRAIESVIAEAPHMEQRLRALQWRIDMERARHPNPLSSCIHVYRMMWDSVYGERGLLEALYALTRPEDATPLRQPTVLPFRRGRRSGGEPAD